MSTVTVPPVERKPEIKRETAQHSSPGRSGAPAVRSRNPEARDQRIVREAEPEAGGEEPGDVCRRSGGGADDGVCHQGCDRRRWRRSSLAFRSPCGCGLPCCSPISRKPWRRRAAKRRPMPCARPRPTRWRGSFCPTTSLKWCRPRKLRAGDVVYCEAGYLIPGDGEVIEGVASVDESVITGESAPVIRESGGDRSAVTGGTKVLVGSHQDPDHLESGRDVPGPHDRAGRRRGAPEDAE